jgi:glycerate kinase
MSFWEGLLLDFKGQRVLFSTVAPQIETGFTILEKRPACGLHTSGRSVQKLSCAQFRVADCGWRIDNSGMPLRVLIVPDKFKGTLTAHAAAEAMAEGWRRIRPEDTLELLPMSDGGDGFGEVISAQMGAKPESLRAVDAAHRSCRAQWWWEPGSRTAIIESANIIGLAKLPPGRFHPFKLDTFGLGAAIRAASAKGARRCLIGIGGSATNDGGFGLARALGWEFLDKSGRAITEWTQLHALAGLRRPKRSRWFTSLVVAVDVQNPLLGAQGCTRIYGPQKGLRKEDFPLAERCLRRLANVVERELGRSYASEPGAGAAGGLGFGLNCFLGARVRAGFDLFAQHAGLAKRLRETDLVLTGEGAIDPQTLMGKGVGQIGHWCRQRNLPCLALAGMVLTRDTKGCFTQAHALTGLTRVEEAKAKPAHWLRQLAVRAAQHYSRSLSPEAKACGNKVKR